MRTAALLLALAAAPARAAETVLSGRLLGGRHLADGRSGRFSGLAAGSAASAWPAGERWTLLPAVSGSWSGVEQALDTAGGTTLFSEQMEHRAALKAVYQPAAARWRLKPSVGWRARLLKETEDEEWLKGLFDHHTVDVGLEWELEARGGAGVRAGYAFSRTVFPNYASLESTAPTDPRGRPLARELAGSRVLDSDAHLLTAAAWTALPWGLRAEGRLGFESRDYFDQKLVRSDGQLSSQTRGDLTTSFEAALSGEREVRLDKTLTWGLEGSLTGTLSDQASYDPARGRYEPRHYNSTAWTLGPTAGLRWGDARAPAAASAALRLGGRSWPHRSARDGSGAYSGEGLREDTVSASADARWPLGPGLALTARLERLWASSNDRFEAAHRFNHEATSVLFGVTFER
ncbi:hypothetical protein EPO15_14955 [bacterium]|nr:MAG: hypothetical protein EPO15_14955 [bacterium]